MEDDILIEIKHKTEDPKEIKKYIIEAISIANEAIKLQNVKKHINGQIRKIIYVPGRTINILT